MSPDQNNLRILLSSDDTDEQFIFRTALEEVEPGAEVMAFMTSRELIQNLQMFSTEKEINCTVNFLLIADLKPPFFSLSDIKHIREIEGFNNLPVHIFSEGFAGIEANEAHSNGATTFSYKPASLNEMRRMFKELLLTHYETKPKNSAQVNES